MSKKLDQMIREEVGRAQAGLEGRNTNIGREFDAQADSGFERALVGPGKYRVKVVDSGYEVIGAPPGYESQLGRTITPKDRKLYSIANRELEQAMGSQRQLSENQALDQGIPAFSAELDPDDVARMVALGMLEPEDEPEITGPSMGSAPQRGVHQVVRPRTWKDKLKDALKSVAHKKPPPVIGGKQLGIPEPQHGIYAPHGPTGEEPMGESQDRFNQMIQEELEFLLKEMVDLDTDTDTDAGSATDTGPDTDTDLPFDAEASSGIKVKVPQSEDPSPREFLKHLLKHGNQMGRGLGPATDPRINVAPREGKVAKAMKESQDPFKRISELALKPYSTCKYED